MTDQTKNQTNETTEIKENEVSILVRENEQYSVVKENGKFKRKAKFNDYSSIKVETKEDKIWLLNLMEGGEEVGQGLKDHVGKQIIVHDIITRPYDRINEDTGEMEYGVLTYLITPEKVAYVTSSKTVYFSITRIMELFGRPDENGWEDITVKVGKEKGQNGDIIKIKMIG